MNPLAIKVRTLRDKNGWTQTELGRRANVPQSAIHYIESGKRNPRTDTLSKLAKALGVKASDLLEEQVS
jgi:transcriptional regulator with XRE-family HTH domain